MNLVKQGRIVETESKNIKVGDIVLIKEDEFFPADLVLLASSNEKASCLVKTSSLDGETAPKLKKVAKDLDWKIPSGGKQSRLSELLCTGKVTVEAPNSNLYLFEGKLEVAGRQYSLSYEQFLLKNT